jgi:hypothetical protein
MEICQNNATKANQPLEVIERSTHSNSQHGEDLNCRDIIHYKVYILSWTPTHVGHQVLIHNILSTTYRLNIYLRLSLANLLDRTIIIDVNVQPLRLVVHRLHAIGLENAVLLGEIVLCEGLSHASQPPLPPDRSLKCHSEEKGVSYNLIVLLANLLAHKLAHPVVT